MGLCQSKADDEALPPTLPAGYELRRCGNVGAAWLDSWGRLRDVTCVPAAPAAAASTTSGASHAPPAAPAAEALLAKMGTWEANGHHRLRRAYRRVAHRLPRSPHVVACVALSAKCVVMPRFETSLCNACKAGQLDVGDILSICGDMVRGVVFLAACGLVHCDLAPQNVALERVAAAGHGTCAWRGVIIDLETLRPVYPGSGLWASYGDTRPVLYGVARHHRFDDVGSRVDVVDELEAVGWTLLWAVCSATGTPFPLAEPQMPTDPLQFIAETEAAAKAAGRLWGLHPAETRFMHAKTALRAMLAGQGPQRAGSGGFGGTGSSCGSDRDYSGSCGSRGSSGCNSRKSGGSTSDGSDSGGSSGGDRGGSRGNVVNGGSGGSSGGRGGGSKDAEGEEGTPSNIAIPTAAASSQPAVACAIMLSPAFAPVRAYFAALASLPRRAPALDATTTRRRGGVTVWSDLVSLPPAEVDMLTRCLTLPAAGPVRDAPKDSPG